jgi:DNA-binding IclR family transcriptional regulator
MKKKNVPTQENNIYQYLQTYTATAEMISKATGIKHSSVCRYKKNLEQKGLLKEVEKKKCRITGCMAWYLSANIARNIPNVLQEIRDCKALRND